MLITLNLIKIFFAGLSCYLFLKSAKIKLPTPPNAGDIIDAEYNHSMTACLIKMSDCNKWACIALFIAMIFELTILFLN